jgi:hypothetical protein
MAGDESKQDVGLSKRKWSHAQIFGLNRNRVNSINNGLAVLRFQKPA